MNFVDSYMGLHGWPKILRITPTETECKSSFSSISQHLRPTKHSTFLIAKILKIRFSETEYEADFSTI